MTDPKHTLAPIRWPKLLPWVVIAAGVLAYANTLGNEFIFDDTAFLTGSLAIRDWGDVAGIVTGSRRWLANLTFALNWLVDGTEPRGYHLVNLLIHAAAGAALYGVVRRAGVRKLGPATDAAGGAGYDEAAWLAFAVALLWTLHPLATQAVTYTIQRHESMMGLFYLLTLYGAARTAEAQEKGEERGERGGRQVWAWAAATVLACAAGMASKEVMLTAPVVALLYDRAFFAGSFLAALRGRWMVYALLPLTWLLLIRGGIAELTGEGSSAGFMLPTTKWWEYLLSQGEVILWYLRLSFLPWPLVLDYGWLPATMAARVPGRLLIEVVVPVSAVAALGAVGLYGLVRNRVWGFLITGFFLALSVSSSVIPIADIAMEHRMYVPLAAVVALATAGVWWVLRWWSPLGHAPVAGVLLAAAALSLGILTVQRNAEYATGVSIWTTVVERAPDNPRGWHNLGEAYGNAGDPITAIRMYEEAINRVPSYADARHNIGQMWLDIGRPVEAEGQFREAIKYRAGDADSHVGLSAALLNQGRAADAEAAAREALALHPRHARGHNNLGVALGMQGRGEEAIGAFRAAIVVNPDLLDAHRNLVTELVRADRIGEAASAAAAHTAAAERGGADPAMVEELREVGRQLHQLAEEKAQTR